METPIKSPANSCSIPDTATHKPSGLQQPVKNVSLHEEDMLNKSIFPPSPAPFKPITEFSLSQYLMDREKKKSSHKRQLSPTSTTPPIMTKRRNHQSSPIEIQSVEILPNILLQPNNSSADEGPSTLQTIAQVHAPPSCANESPKLSCFTRENVLGGIDKASHLNSTVKPRTLTAAKALVLPPTSPNTQPTFSDKMRENLGNYGPNFSALPSPSLKTPAFKSDFAKGYALDRHLNKETKKKTPSFKPFSPLTHDKSQKSCRPAAYPTLSSRRFFIQCYCCQHFGHGKNECRRGPRCLKCAENHLTSACSKPRNSPAKCCNCGGAHISAYKGCPAYQKAKKVWSAQWAPQRWGQPHSRHQYQRFQQHPRQHTERSFPVSGHRTRSIHGRLNPYLPRHPKNSLEPQNQSVGQQRPTMASYSDNNLHKVMQNITNISENIKLQQQQVDERLKQDTSFQAKLWEKLGNLENFTNLILGKLNKIIICLGLPLEESVDKEMGASSLGSSVSLMDMLMAGDLIQI